MKDNRDNNFRMKEKISHFLDTISLLARTQGKYILVGFVFLIFVLYGIIFKQYTPLPSASVKGVEVMRYDDPEITRESKEVSYKNIFQGKQNDWYRLKLMIRSDTEVKIDVKMEAVFEGPVNIGSFTIANDRNAQYRELVFRVPEEGLFTDLSFSLSGEQADDVSFAGKIDFENVSLLRLDIQNNYAASRIRPSLVGMVEYGLVGLNKAEVSLSPKSVFESSFVAQESILDAIVLRAQDIRNNKGFIIELRKRAVPGSNKESISIKKVILKPGELGDISDSAGYQKIDFPVIFEKGAEYYFDIQALGETGLNLKFLPIESFVGYTLPKNSLSTVGLITGKRPSVTNGHELLIGAIVEDDGNNIHYSYALPKNKHAYFDLHDKSSSVKYDVAQERVVGSLEHGAYFVYKFDLTEPFQKISLTASQEREAPKELKIEYSTDAQVWLPILESGPLYELNLVDSSHSTVYLRVTFIGINKKTASFSLDSLVVRAQKKKL